MDPIQPIVPQESAYPILPAPPSPQVQREQRRRAYQEGRHSQEQPDGYDEPGDDEDLEEFEPVDLSGTNGEEEPWDGVERRTTPRAEAAPAPERPDDGGPGHIDISV